MSVAKPKLAYSRREFAEATGLSEATIKRAIATGNLAEQHPVTGDEGRRVTSGVILAEELDRWLKT